MIAICHSLGLTTNHVSTWDADLHDIYCIRQYKDRLDVYTVAYRISRIDVSGDSLQY